MAHPLNNLSYSNQDEMYINMALTDIHNECPDINLQYKSFEAIPQYRAFSILIDQVQLKNTPADFKSLIDLDTFVTGSFFNSGFNDMLQESKYIIAFIVGCKSWILKRKNAYLRDSGMSTDLNGNSLTNYQLMSKLAQLTNMNNPSLPPIDINPCPELLEQSLSMRLKATDIPDNKPLQKDWTMHQLLCVGVATVLFLFLSNSYLYKLTGKITGDSNGCPSFVGNLLHACVFFGLYFVLVKCALKGKLVN